MSRSQSFLISAVLWLSIFIVDSLTACSYVQERVAPRPTVGWRQVLTMAEETLPEDLTAADILLDVVHSAAGK